MDKKPSERELWVIRLPARARNKLSIPKDGVRGNIVTLMPAENTNLSIEASIRVSYIEDIRSHKTRFPRIDLGDTVFASRGVFNALGLEDQDGPVEIILETNEGKFLIGADPEFGIFDNDGKLIAAREYLSHASALGSDGQLAEVRPKPAYTPAQLIKNIEVLFKDEECVKNIRRYVWRAMCFHKGLRVSAGGHIHIGNIERVEDMPYLEKKAFIAVMNKILDEKLGVLLVRFDGEEEGSSRRLLNGYGGFGSFRFNEGHLEYRTPSGLWLAHPSLAFSVVGTAYAVAEEVYRLCYANDFDIDYILPEDIVPLIRDARWADAYDTLYRRNYEGWPTSGLCRDIESTRASLDIKNILSESKPGWITKSVVKSWHAHMQNLSTYSKHEISIEMLKEFLSIPLESLRKMNTNLKETWLEAQPLIHN